MTDEPLLNPFRINTCKSVSKQRTLTTFRMNTYEKPRGGGPLFRGTDRAHPPTEQTESIPDTVRARTCRNYEAGRGLCSGQPRCQGGGVVMGNRLDRNHGIHSRGARQCGAIHHVEIADLPTLALGISRGSSGRTAHPRGPHDMERKQSELRRVPAGGIHILNQAGEGAATPWFVSAPFRVWRINQFRAGSFQDAGRADKSMPQVLAVKWRKRVVRNWLPLLIHGYAAAIAVPHQSPDPDGIRQLFEQRTIMLGLPPGQNRGFDCRLQRGGLQRSAVISAQEAKLIGVDRLHRAFPRANLFGENTGHVRDGMKMQVPAN